MKIRFDCNHVDELAEAAEILVNYFKNERIFLFYGEMGAGKTTFIKAIAKELGVAEETSSPTFGFVNEYTGSNKRPIFHFDCYRVKNQEDALSIGFQEYFDSGNFCLVEWPEMIPDFLPEHFVKVQIKEKDRVRVIEMEKQ
jgi:tRNA threonylcarbamoyladenosine biosynthesis protein TsaE